ncbi:MAG TPA: adenylate/guanylate cyclase domain-containing protein, partial [Longimicrobiales bacterium]|nr:adenylate/guanylate cyclase domain-containing protein [Longimicrobiales bacterium]
EGIDLPAALEAAQRTGRLQLADIPPSQGELRPGAAVHMMPLRYAGPPSAPDRSDGAFTAVSSDAMASAGEYFDFAVGEDFFRDKIVLIGSGYHYEDRFRTPYYNEELPGSGGEAADRYGWMYGVEVHANAVQSLLSRRYIQPFGASREVGLPALLALGVAALTFWRGVGAGAAGLAGLLALTWAGAWAAFDRGFLHVPLVTPMLAGLFAFLGSTSYVSIVEGRDKRVLRRAFSKYVPPAVVDQLVADPSRIKLGGEKRHISILFSDLAGFTSLSESMEPERLVSLLNEYLEEMATIVLDEGGTLDKYIGDAIMTLYGAPAAQSDHALRACRTALRMHRRLEDLNAEWATRGVDVRELSMRIGINTGTPVVGNIGGEKRFDYTALGDAVNLAARLEPACKTYGVATMISATTRDAVGNAVVTRELELLAVYGKNEPVPVYELVAMAGQELGGRAELVDLYERGLSAYRNRDFELAEQYFRAGLEVDPADGPSALYLERSQAYRLSPPPVDWDFVERRQVK